MLNISDFYDKEVASYIIKTFPSRRVLNRDKKSHGASLRERDTQRANSIVTPIRARSLVRWFARALERVVHPAHDRAKDLRREKEENEAGGNENRPVLQARGVHGEG